MKRFCICSLLIPPKGFDIFSPINGGCSKGLGVLWFLFKVQALGRVLIPLHSNCSTAVHHNRANPVRKFRHINWSMVTCKIAAPVTGTMLRTTDPVPADSRQWTSLIRNCVTRFSIPQSGWINVKTFRWDHRLHIANKYKNTREKRTQVGESRGCSTVVLLYSVLGYRWLIALFCLPTAVCARSARWKQSKP